MTFTFVLAFYLVRVSANQNSRVPKNYDLTCD